MVWKVTTFKSEYIRGVCASCAIYHESFIPVADGIHIIMTVERIKWKMDTGHFSRCVCEV